MCVCDKMDPRRLKKDMLKSLKLIKAEDRVLIMGTSKSPLLADIKSFGKMFNKIILIPRPDYGSRCSKIGHCTHKLINVSMLTRWWYSMTTDSGFSLVEDADRKTGRRTHKGAGSQLPGQNLWWLHGRSHGPGDRDRHHQASHPAAGEETADCDRVCRASG